MNYLSEKVLHQYSKLAAGQELLVSAPDRVKKSKYCRKCWNCSNCSENEREYDDKDVPIAPTSRPGGSLLTHVSHLTRMIVVSLGPERHDRSSVPGSLSLGAGD